MRNLHNFSTYISNAYILIKDACSGRLYLGLPNMLISYPIPFAVPRILLATLILPIYISLNEKP